MFINFEFLDNDAIENVITSLHYKMDKVIFFADEESIAKNKKKTINFLTEYCNVKEVEFYSVSSTDINQIKDVIWSVIKAESIQDNKLYFDITGGENLILVAFGMLAEKLNLPMHFYDIETDSIIELNNSTYSISTTATKQNIKLDIDKYIRMQGGIVNAGLHKSFKALDTEEDEELINKIWKVAKEYHTLWNLFTNFMRDEFESTSLYVNYNKNDIFDKLIESKNNLNSPYKLLTILIELNDAGAIEYLTYKNDYISFQYKNYNIKKCLCEGGMILELHTYAVASKDSNDCQVGVHIDWDGVIHDPFSFETVDVLNEVDVISLKGNIPTYISCKSGKMTNNDALRGMYELDTIARHFGGKYTKKAMAFLNPLRDVDVQRAKAMKIKIL